MFEHLNDVTLDFIGVLYDCDRLNYIVFKDCKNIEGERKTYARPDFFLPDISICLQALVFIGNDEFAHRQNACDLQRLWNIVQALEQTPEFKGLPIVYVRFNPHSYKRGSIFHSYPTLDVGNKLIMSTLHSLNSSQFKPGVNLIYIHYDQDANGDLLLFADSTENDFVEIFKPCVLMNI